MVGCGHVLFEESRVVRKYQLVKIVQLSLVQTKTQDAIEMPSHIFLNHQVSSAAHTVMKVDGATPKWVPKSKGPS